MSLSPINGLKKFNIVLVVYKHFVSPALSRQTSVCRWFLSVRYSCQNRER